jgi:competence/damage-inducible protein CinA-like protein
MTAAILCIGTELTRGELVDTNSAWLAEALTALGFEVAALDCTDDDPERIQQALCRLGAAHEVLMCTGGLGPTTDDLTTECVAAVLGVPLERDPTSLEAIRARIERFGRTMASSNAKQADFPAGARILPNREGTAPGFSVRIDRALSFFMPGVPREMKAMFDAEVVSELRPLVAAELHQVRLKTFGMAESAVNDRLAGIEAEHGVVIGYRAHFPEIEVKLLARDRDLAKAEARARAAAVEVRARLGDVVYAEGEVTLPEVVGRLLLEKKLMLGVAESCTGGLLSELITARSGASAFYNGAVVSYSNDVKQRLLGVSAELLERHGAVSAEVARAMAEGARKALRADITAAITGVAGPNGGTPEKPVGLVHYAVATEHGSFERKLMFPSGRQQIQMVSAFRALSLLRDVLLGKAAPDAP